MKTLKKLVMTLFLFILMIAVPTSVYAAGRGEISVETTLTDGVTLKGSKKTFDVIARLNGNKILSHVTLNGEDVDPNWDDQNKTSYTLKFNREGKNTVVVSGYFNNKIVSKTYNITYKKAAKGEFIGYSTWTVEALTIGRGYIVEPIKVPIYEGENSAQTLDRILTEKGYSYDFTGRLESGFYLSRLGDGGELKGGCKDLKKSRSINVPVNIEDKVPNNLKAVLEKKGKWPTHELDDSKCLGEFDYTFMSGWMYAINNVFPNVGFSDSYPSDGDVVRVQFTLYGYGADLGGGYAMGGQSTDFYKVANKDRLISLISSINSEKDKKEKLSNSYIKSAYDEAMKVAEKLDATQTSVNEAYFKLDSAINIK